MKSIKALALFVVLLSISCISIAQNKVVVKPICKSNTTTFCIDKLELYDDKTVLDCRIYDPNARVSLSSQVHLKGKSGKTHELIKCDGIDLDASYDRENHHKFTLTFPALDKDDDIFHLYEKKDGSIGAILENIYTYTPEGVEPFICTIKGELVGLPDCKVISLTLGVSNRHLDKYIIPVVNGRFEFTEHFNHMEAYQIVPQSGLNPMGKRPTAQFSQLYVEPGEIHVVLNSRETGKANKIIRAKTGENIEKKPIDLTSLFGSDTLIFRNYPDIYRMEPKRGVDMERSKPTVLNTPRELLSQETIKKFDSISNKWERNAFQSATNDRLLAEATKLQSLPGFYNREGEAIAKEYEEANKRCREKEFKYLTENPSVYTLDHLSGKIFGLRVQYPAAYKYAFHEFEGKRYMTDIFPVVSKEEAAEQINRYAEIFETVYKPLYPHHPYTKTIEWQLLQLKKTEAL